MFKIRVYSDPLYEMFSGETMKYPNHISKLHKQTGPNFIIIQSGLS